MASLMQWAQAHQQSIAYAIGGFSSAILTTLFGLYGVVLFTNVIKLNTNVFYAGHILYGIWNAVNDPMFGWLIDHTANKSNRRLPVIKYGGPLWCLTFMCTWYPWSWDGESWLAAAHFLFSMFCFDGFLTYVLIVKCDYIFYTTTPCIIWNLLDPAPHLSILPIVLTNSYFRCFTGRSLCWLWRTKPPEQFGRLVWSRRLATRNNFLLFLGRK